MPLNEIQYQFLNHLRDQKLEDVLAQVTRAPATGAAAPAGGQVKSKRALFEAADKGAGAPPRRSAAAEAAHQAKVKELTALVQGADEAVAKMVAVGGGKAPTIQAIYDQAKKTAEAGDEKATTTIMAVLRKHIGKVAPKSWLGYDQGKLDAAVVGELNKSIADPENPAVLTENRISLYNRTVPVHFDALLRQMNDKPGGAVKEQKVIRQGDNLVAILVGVDGARIEQSLVEGIPAIQEFRNRTKVINAQVGDKIIDESVAVFEKVKDTEAVEYSMDFANESPWPNPLPGEIILVAHGDETHGLAGTVHAATLNHKPAEEYVSYLTKKLNDPKYAGTIFLDACYSAAGAEQGENPSDIHNFAKRVYDGLVDAGYQHVQLRGNLGKAWTVGEAELAKRPGQGVVLGDELVFDAQERAAAKESEARKQEQKVVLLARARTIEKAIARQARALGVNYELDLDLDMAKRGRLAALANVPELEERLKFLAAGVDPVALRTTIEAEKQKITDFNAQIPQLEADMRALMSEGELAPQQVAQLDVDLEAANRRRLDALVNVQELEERGRTSSPGADPVDLQAKIEAEKQKVTDFNAQIAQWEEKRKRLTMMGELAKKFKLAAEANEIGMESYISKPQILNLSGTFGPAKLPGTEKPKGPEGDIESQASESMDFLEVALVGGMPAEEAAQVMIQRFGLPFAEAFLTLDPQSVVDGFKQVRPDSTIGSPKDLAFLRKVAAVFKKDLANDAQKVAHEAKVKRLTALVEGPDKEMEKAVAGAINGGSNKAPTIQKLYDLAKQKALAGDEKTTTTILTSLREYLGIGAAPKN